MALLSESPESKMPTIFTFTRLRSVEDLPVFPVPPFVLSSAPTAIVLSSVTLSPTFTPSFAASALPTIACSLSSFGQFR